MDQDWKEQHEKDFYYKVHTTQMHLIYTYCTHVEKYIGYYKYIFNLIGSQLKLMGQLGTGGGAREPGGNGQTYNTVETDY